MTSWKSAVAADVFANFRTATRLTQPLARAASAPSAATRSTVIGRRSLPFIGDLVGVSPAAALDPSVRPHG